MLKTVARYNQIHSVLHTNNALLLQLYSSGGILSKAVVYRYPAMTLWSYQMRIKMLIYSCQCL